MPSGASVSARYSCYSRDNCLLDVSVYPLVEDRDRSEGLCGNYNGNQDDDLTPRNSATVDNRDEPVTFASSYLYDVHFSHYTVKRCLFYRTCTA